MPPAICRWFLQVHKLNNINNLTLYISNQCICEAKLHTLQRGLSDMITHRSASEDQVPIIPHLSCLVLHLEIIRM